MLKKIALIAAASVLLSGTAVAAATTTTADVAAPSAAVVQSQSLVGVSEHDNNVSLFGANPVDSSSISFTWDTGYSITGGQPWGGVTTSDNQGEPLITADAGRSGSSGPASWFMARTSLPIATDASPSDGPDELNFAFSGTLTIEGNSYPVVFGQGHSGVNNNWWFGGQGSGWKTFEFSPWGVTTPDGKYVISVPPGDTDDEFMVELASAAS